MADQLLIIFDGQRWQWKIGKQEQRQQSDSCLKGSMGRAVVGRDQVTET